MPLSGELAEGWVIVPGGFHRVISNASDSKLQVFLAQGRISLVILAAEARNGLEASEVDAIEAIHIGIISVDGEGHVQILNDGDIDDES